VEFDFALTSEYGGAAFRQIPENNKESNMRVKITLCAVAVCLGLVSIATAQDAVKVDPKHYSVVSENDQVRILKVHYGAHEKSVMHSHPDEVAVFLSETKGQFTFPDGKKQDFNAKAGDAQYGAAITHLPENTSEQPFDLIVVELKGHAAKAKSATKSETKSEMK
jgi:quercetin dioxygenase-like cupin family protein